MTPCGHPPVPIRLLNLDLCSRPQNVLIPNDSWPSAPKYHLYLDIGRCQEGGDFCEFHLEVIETICAKTICANAPLSTW